MKYSRVLVSLSLACLSTLAQADDDKPAYWKAWYLVPTMTTASPFIFTSSKEEQKRVDTRDEAAAFVASQGALRGAVLEHALAELKQQAVYADEDDLSLATELLIDTH